MPTAKVIDLIDHLFTVRFRCPISAADLGWYPKPISLIGHNRGGGWITAKSEVLTSPRRRRGLHQEPQFGHETNCYCKLLSFQEQSEGYQNLSQRNNALE